MPDPRWLVVLVALVVVAGYAALGNSTVLADMGGDNAAYWLTAQGWSPWQAPSALARRFANASTYPPLYPLLLAWLGGGHSLLAAHTLTVGMLLLGFAALAGFCRASGLGTLASAGVTLTFACLSTVRLEGLELHSEPLYLLLSMLALTLTCRLRVTPTARTALLLGLAVAAALLTRSCGVTLLAALGFSALRERRWPWFAALVPGGLAMVANALLQRSQQRYAGEFLARFDPGDLAQVLLVNFKGLPGAWAAAIAGQQASIPVVVALGVFGLLAVAAAGWRAWRGHLDGHYALLYLLTVAVWPFPAETVRLFMPVAGLLTAQLCLAASALTWGKLGPAPRQLWWAPLLFALPDALGFAARFFLPLPPDLAPYRYTTAWQHPVPAAALLGIGAMRAADQAFALVESTVPPEDCVLSIKPGVLTALAHREGKGPPMPNLDEAAFEASLASLGCRYALLFAFSSPTYHDAFYPAARLAGRLKELAIIPNALDTKRPAFVLVELLAQRLDAPRPGPTMP